MGELAWGFAPIKNNTDFKELNPVGWKEFLNDSTPRFGGEKKFTIQEIRQYLQSQIGLNKAIANLSVENIKLVN